MKKKYNHPYMRPIVRSFEKTDFLKESQVILNFLRKGPLKKVSISEDNYWIFINERKPKKLKNGSWMPKLYICVLPKYFWSTVSDLILLSREEKFSWKFSKDLKSFSRPDKIIIYADNEGDLKRILKKVQPEIKAKKFHKLEFAKPLSQEGLYMGADPTFIKGASWRLYRWSIEQALIKPNLKKGPLDRNTRQALNAMNVSLKHPGPKRLSPNKKFNKFILEVWKEVTAK
jgi:hypothetical protein